MKLFGAVTEGSGVVNEDGFGVSGPQENISAAWIFDGVTGINGGNYLPAGSDARWLVEAAHRRLLSLALLDIELSDLLRQLVAGLIADWELVKQSVSLPAVYDPPAACLILVKRYGEKWKALRLGDSCLLARDADTKHRIFAASPNNAFDHWLSREARKRRDAGILDIKTLLAEFRPQLLEGRQKRNLPGGYSILECSEAALRIPEFIELGQPERILLCTDGYYRAVDHYQLHDDQSLIEASERGVEEVLRGVRAAEASDPTCERFLRFKPADDATAVILGS